MIIKFNKFHLVTQRPWPILVSIQLWSTMLNVVIINQIKNNKTLINIAILILISFMWWNNTIKETNEEGIHQNKTIRRIKIGILMFIISEVMFFTRFFWSYFHSIIRPNVELGQSWPPKEIKTFNPINVPILNTIILIRSGFSITHAHHLMIKNKINKAVKMITITVIIGIYFSALQGIEYMQAEFSINDSSYGTTFFIATGFHGIHVLVGSSYIIINLLIIKKIYLTKINHIGFEIATWYWHFVDVVWLFLYISVYWWGI